MKNILVLSLFLLLFSPVVHAGIIEDITGGIAGLLGGLGELFFGVPKPDAESVCIENTISNYRSYLESDADITESVAFRAYDEYNACKNSPNSVANYFVDCAKKIEMQDFCKALKQKCESSKISDERFTSARSAGGCFVAENMCSGAINKNYAQCNRGRSQKPADTVKFDSITAELHENELFNTADGSSAPREGNSFVSVSSSQPNSFTFSRTSSEKFFIITESTVSSVPVGRLYYLGGSNYVAGNLNTKKNSVPYRYSEKTDTFTVEFRQADNVILISSKRRSPFESTGTKTTSNVLLIPTSLEKYNVNAASFPVVLSGSNNQVNYNYRD